MSHQAITWGVVAALAGIWGQASAAQRCESLVSLKLPNTTITLAQSVAAGALVPPPGPLGPPGAPPPDFKHLPAFCRVAATIRPTKDSDIRVEVWLPASGWNGRLRGGGNGAFAGVIELAGMTQALQDHNAAVSTDTGHSIPQDGDMANVSWALGHPEKVTDFGYRAVHEMTPFAKATVKAFYGSGPHY
jgi:feruloyl esterase